MLKIIGNGVAHIISDIWSASIFELLLIKAIHEIKESNPNCPHRKVIILVLLKHIVEQIETISKTNKATDNGKIVI